MIEITLPPSSASTRWPAGRIATPDRAAVAFSSVLLGRLVAQAGKPVLWVGGDGETYAPGLAALGLPPSLEVTTLAGSQAFGGVV